MTYNNLEARGHAPPHNEPTADSAVTPPDAVRAFWVPSGRQYREGAPDDEPVSSPEDEVPEYPTGPDFTAPEWDEGEGLYRMVQSTSVGERVLWSATLGDLWHKDPWEARKAARGVSE
ncbi:MAG: hypothetical protein JW990_11580 [Thermoleophilia bacterium]|nr:hypothetical protein [Thermoleophilia bacterium]